jgi:hypothetical protein
MEREEVEKLSTLQALKLYFGASRPVDMAELKALTSEDRNELGELAKAALLSELQ